MGHAQAAAVERLPWLPDEPRAAAKRGSKRLAPWVAVAIGLIGAAAYWIGASSSDWVGTRGKPSSTVTTVQLPEPKPTPAQPAQPQVQLRPQPQVKIERVPQIERIVAPPMPVIDQAPEDESSAATDDEQQATAETPAPVPKAAPADPLQLWPVRVLDGASGRLVRIGTFATAHQAKKGWWAIVRINPALQRLPALVVPVQSLRDGRIYYRLQMGTTSQAHSELLCQRMRMIGQSCVVIGVADRANAGR